MKQCNIFEEIPEDLAAEQFEEILSAEGLTLERIVSKGHISPKEGWYDQEQNEWVMVVKGAATILFEAGEKIELIAGSYLEIAAGKKHKVSWTDPGVETIWLALHY